MGRDIAAARISVDRGRDTIAGRLPDLPRGGPRGSRVGATVEVLALGLLLRCGGLSKLFDEICELPEYYLTRVETEILERHAGHDRGLPARDLDPRGAR